MTLRQAKLIELGAVVRRSWFVNDDQMGIIISKKHVRKKHMAKCLGGLKKERYDFEVCWLTGQLQDKRRQKLYQNWELMIISRGT